MKFSEIQRLKYLYEVNHLSIQQIARQTHHDPTTISKYLKEAGVEIQLGLRKWEPTEDQLQIMKRILEEEHGSYKDVARTLNKDSAVIKRVTQEHGIIYDYRPYNKNLKHDFFSVIDSPEKAWLLGFLWTDGSVRKVSDKSCQIRLSIQMQDEPMIDKIKNWLHIDTKTLYDRRENKECAGIEFISNQIFEDISKYGIVPNKTYVTNSLHIDKIPEQFQRDYIRGIFDGDGILSFAGDINEVSCGFISHFYESVAEFQTFVDNKIDKTVHNIIITEKGKSYTHWRGRKQVTKILDLLYKDATVYLPRKYEKYLKIKTYDQ